MPTTEVNQMLAAAAAACEDKKAEDIRILALDPSESGLADYFLICNGTNSRQNVAITDEIELRLKREFATYPNSVEGRREGEWVLMDYVDFIVHVFSPEKRAYYGLERLRKSATTLSIDELNTEIKTAIEANRPKPRKVAATKTSAKKTSATKAAAAKSEKASKAVAGTADGAAAKTSDAPARRAVSAKSAMAVKLAKPTKPTKPTIKAAAKTAGASAAKKSATRKPNRSPKA